MPRKPNQLKKEYKKTIVTFAVLVAILISIPIIYIVNPKYNTGIVVDLQVKPLKQYIYIHISGIDVIMKPPFLTNKTPIMLRVIIYPYNSTKPIYNTTLITFRPIVGINPAIDRVLTLPVKPTTRGYSIRLWDNFTKVSVPVAYVFFDGPRFHTYPGSSFYRAGIVVALVNKGIIVEKKGWPSLDIYCNFTYMDGSHGISHIVIGPGNNNVTLLNTRDYLRVSLAAYHLFFIMESKLVDNRLVIDARSNWALLLLASFLVSIGIYFVCRKYKRLSRRI